MNPFRVLIESLRYAKRVHDGKPVISTVYPIRMVPRWQGGSGIPQISRIFEKSEDRIKRNLAELAEFKRVVEEIELGRKEFSIEWRSMMPVLDGLSIMWAAANTGRRFVEIGSGTSTRYARAALGEKADPALLISIDPEPRREINTICDQVIRKPLEETDLGLFEELEPGDTVFVDNSHQSFMNSDVTAVMIDVVPRISAGVLIGFHDVFLPFDYPQSWSARGYNEQYLLACFFLSNPDYFQVELANAYASSKQYHCGPLAGVWNLLGDDVKQRGGSAIWLRKN